MSGALRQILAVWGVLDIQNLEASFAEYLTLSEPIIREAKHNSARAASGYYDMLRVAEAVPGPPPASKFLADLVASGELEMTLGPIGPAAIRKGIEAGMTFEQSAAAAWVKQSGQLAKHVQAGSRNTLAQRIAGDERALGFQRAPHKDGKCCAFCGVVASRGAVYKDRATSIASSNPNRLGKDYHDHCRCTPQPIFRRDTPLSPAGERFAALYEKHKSLNEVRRELDGRETAFDRKAKASGGDD
ncbi:hypothetical protein OG401_23800 [Kitasatospora purpeofusca]|nr:hypothetical protein [Kitasatospora purpeofusca]MCX4687288.1 hypothetical protein [Kitasatospora purpeofusca]